MVIGTCSIIILVPGSASLKDKRRVVRSIIAKTRSRFNVSIAETGNLDSWQVAELGLACVSNSSRHADEMVQTINRFIENQLLDGYVDQVDTEIIHLR
ncbi:MAG TPA: DUF503 domain-containing protein [Thermomicrobiaceae bacterium]|nr:DUF503 domain-containing protein [Thermomicrobiaceae bacterium]